MTRMNAMRAELAVRTTRSNNLRIYNFVLQDLVNRLESRVEASEEREEEYRVLLGELRQVVGSVVFSELCVSLLPEWPQKFPS